MNQSSEAAKESLTIKDEGKYHIIVMPEYKNAIEKTQQHGEPLKSLN